MAPQHLATLPIGTPPQAHGRFHRASRDIATLSAALLELSDSPLMALAVPSDGWTGRAPILVWDQRLTPCRDRVRRICDTDLYGPVLDALCLATDDLFECLREASICPADAIGLSVVTDGIGVALTAETPCPDSAGAGWLLSLVGRAARAVTILPLAADGVWMLLNVEADARSVH